MSNVTVRVSPGSSGTRSKPFSSLTGRVTLETTIADVELDDFVAGGRAGVGHVDRHARRLADGDATAVEPRLSSANVV